MFFIATTLVFILLYALLMGYYYRCWQQQSTFEAKDIGSHFISVVIAARNEETTLPLLIADLQAQDYPPHLFEVIIVNDFSTDGTATHAEKLPANFQMILPQATSAETSSKKKSIATGINVAKGPLLLITDADCRLPEKWISTYAAFYQSTKADFIAAPVKFSYHNRLLQIFQAIDFMSLQGITAAGIQGRLHNMCNGANLAYTKKAFEAVNGFDGIDKKASGDDMLLMHKIWQQDPSKIYYLKSKDVIVSTLPMQSWKEFFMQRRRWASKTFVYDDYKIKAILFFILIWNGWLLALFIMVLFSTTTWWLFVAAVGAKTIIEWPFVAAVAKFYEEKKLMRYFVFFQPLHIIYTVTAGVWSQLGGYSWKGRRTQ